jgi:hypothetical protein
LPIFANTLKIVGFLNPFPLAMGLIPVNLGPADISGLKTNDKYPLHKKRANNFEMIQG